MLQNRLPPADWLHWPETEALVAAFAAAKIPLRFVGGAVRDTLLKRKVTDVDAATPASPQKVMALLQAAGIKAVPTGLSHGTITAVVSSPITEQGSARSGGGLGVKTPNQVRSFEITTLRRDIKTFGRHAEVLFTDSWEEDAARRDFTMNALYCDADGQIYDFFGGITDAKMGRVLFIGDPQKRIQEDALRILRFFRFQAHYGEGGIDPSGLAACVAEKHRIAQLSGERISAEMLKLLAADKAAEILAVMQETGVLEEVLPGIAETASLEALARVRLMADLESIDPMIALALLLRSQNQRQYPLSSLITRWKLSNKQSAWLYLLVSSESIPAEMEEAAQKKLLRKLGMEEFCALVLVSWAERLSEQPSKPQILSAAYRSMLGLPERWQPPVFPVSGDDLRQIGIPVGPEMGRLLTQLEERWENDEYQPTKTQLLNFVTAHQKVKTEY